ncbi:hypothetical protein ACXZ1K_01085 [Pedobacter sp. PWIIR3]
METIKWFNKFLYSMISWLLKPVNTRQNDGTPAGSFRMSVVL